MIPTEEERQAAAATIAAIEAGGRTERVGVAGRQVVWHRFGAGPPLVLMHGGHGSWLHWLANIAALARGREVLVPDLPGYGLSDTLPGDGRDEGRLASLVAATQATLDALVGGGVTIDLAGFSFGGLAAARLAAVRGGVGRLALIGSAGHGTQRRMMTPLVNWRLPDPAARMAALEANLRAFMLHEPGRADAVALAIHEWSCERTRFRSKELSGTGELFALVDAIDAPVLALWGEHDVTAVPPRLAAQLAEGRPHVQAGVVPGAGHWLQYERADVVDARLGAFFDVARAPTAPSPPTARPAA